MPIVLVLDTNVLRQEGLASRNMQFLSRLTCAGEVALFVPRLVAREFVSQRLVEARSQVEKCNAAISDIGRLLGAKSPVQPDVADLKSRLTALGGATAAVIPQELEDWIASCKATVIDFEPLDINGVLDDYFAGSGAFSKIKHRDDFPDAIVSASMRPLLKTCDVVHVAIKDGAFRKHLSAEPRYVLVDSLKEFFELDDVRNVVYRLDALDANVAAVRAFLGGTLFQSRLTDYFRQATDLLENVYVEEAGLNGAGNMKIDGYGYSLNYAQAQAIKDIRYGEVDYIAQDHYSIGVTIRTKARIDFAASYREYLELPDHRDVEEWSMDGDGYCDLREVRDVILYGSAELLFDGVFHPESLEFHSRHLVNGTSKLQIELEIESAFIE